MSVDFYYYRMVIMTLSSSLVAKKKHKWQGGREKMFKTTAEWVGIGEGEGLLLLTIPCSQGLGCVCADQRIL